LKLGTLVVVLHLIAKWRALLLCSCPQRVCDMCAGLLEPLQGFLVGATAASVQLPVHDALDSISLRSWLNNPFGGNMPDELYKAANILHKFNKVR
jgi:hypothetical protein